MAERSSLAKLLHNQDAITKKSPRPPTNPFNSPHIPLSPPSLSPTRFSNIKLTRPFPSLPHSQAEIKTKLTAEINDLGEQIKASKTAGQPKDEWDPLLKQMLALKVTYKEEVCMFSPNRQAKISWWCYPASSAEVGVHFLEMHGDDRRRSFRPATHPSFTRP